MAPLEFAPPDTDTCDALADLHRASLPTSALSVLGPRFLRAFYRFVAHSPMEHLVACRRDGVIVAGALITHQPGSLNRRVLFKTPLIPAVLSHIHRRGVRRAIFSRSIIQWHDAALNKIATPQPEMLALFCRADMRAQGIGGALIEHVDRQLASAGVTRYFVRTVEGQDNPALRFYIRHGFTPVGQIKAHGIKFALLVKNLPVSKADLSAPT